MNVLDGWMTYIFSIGFHMSGKSQTIGDFSVSLPSQIFATNANHKSKTSPITWDGRGRIGKIGSVSIFPTCPRFLRSSAIISDKFVLSETPARDGFRSLLACVAGVSSGRDANSHAPLFARPERSFMSPHGN